MSFINDFPILSTLLRPRLTKINHKDGQVIQIGTIHKFWKSKLEIDKNFFLFLLSLSLKIFFYFLEQLFIFFKLLDQLFNLASLIINHLIGLEHNGPIINLHF